MEQFSVDNLFVHPPKVRLLLDYFVNYIFKVNLIVPNPLKCFIFCTFRCIKNRKIPQSH